MHVNLLKSFPLYTTPVLFMHNWKKQQNLWRVKDWWDGINSIGTPSSGERGHISAYLLLELLQNLSHLWEWTLGDHIAN